MQRYLPEDDDILFEIGKSTGESEELTLDSKQPVTAPAAQPSEDLQLTASAADFNPLRAPELFAPEMSPFSTTKYDDYIASYFNENEENTGAHFSDAEIKLIMAQLEQADPVRAGEKQPADEGQRDQEQQPVAPEPAALVDAGFSKRRKHKQPRASEKQPADEGQRDQEQQPVAPEPAALIDAGFSKPRKRNQFRKMCFLDSKKLEYVVGEPEILINENGKRCVNHNGELRRVGSYGQWRRIQIKMNNDIQPVDNRQETKKPRKRKKINNAGVKFFLDTDEREIVSDKLKKVYLNGKTFAKDDGRFRPIGSDSTWIKTRIRYASNIRKIVPIGAKLEQRSDGHYYQGEKVTTLEEGYRKNKKNKRKQDQARADDAEPLNRDETREERPRHDVKKAKSREAIPEEGMNNNISLPQGNSASNGAYNVYRNKNPATLFQDAAGLNNVRPGKPAKREASELDDEDIVVRLPFIPNPYQ